jgi:hypothetical protein
MQFLISLEWKMKDNWGKAINPNWFCQPPSVYFCVPASQLFDLLLASLSTKPRVARCFFIFQKSLFGYILKGFGMEVFGIFNGRLEYFMAISYTLCQFGILCGILVYLSRFGVQHQEKSGSPEQNSISSRHSGLIQLCYQQWVVASSSLINQPGAKVINS